MLHHIWMVQSVDISFNGLSRCWNSTNTYVTTVEHMATGALVKAGSVVQELLFVRQKLSWILSQLRGVLCSTRWCSMVSSPGITKSVTTHGTHDISVLLGLSPQALKDSNPLLSFVQVSAVKQHNNSIISRITDNKYIQTVYMQYTYTHTHNLR